MAFQKVLNAQFLLENKSQVLRADLLTAAPRRWQPRLCWFPTRGRRSLGCLGRCLLHRKPTEVHTPPITSPHANAQTTKHNHKDSRRESLLDSGAHSGMRGLEAGSHFLCGRGVSLQKGQAAHLGSWSLIVQWDISEQSEPWRSLVQAKLALSSNPSALGGSLTCCPHS